MLRGLLLCAGPLEIGVVVVGTGRRELEFSGHDGLWAFTFEVIDEAEFGGGGWALRGEDGGVRVRQGDGVVDDVALAVEVEREQRGVVGSEGVGIREDSEAVVMGAVGINLSALAIFSGAAGVGIGFGLQKIVANFISGIILLVDKSVKPGDLVTIGDSSGRISAMKTRYISVAAGDGREFLIPNEDLVTQKVTNWTYTDKNTLVKVNFGANYDADPRLVCKLAIEIAAAAPRAIKLKPPSCILVEFAEAGMKFSLTFWVPDPDGMDNVKSDVMLSLWDAFKREGIHVPYPVREIRVRGGALPVETIVEASS